MTQKERELLIGVARACHVNFGNLVSEIEAEAQPAPAPAPQVTPEDDPDLTAAFMAGFERGKDAAVKQSLTTASLAAPTPEDMEKAREVKARYYRDFHESKDAIPGIEDYIASALVSERQRTAERCAEIAREVAKSYGSESGMQDRRGVGADVVMRLIHREFGLEPGNAKGATE